MKNILRETDQFFAEHMPLVTRRLLYVNVLLFLLAQILFVFMPGDIFRNVIERAFYLRPTQAIYQFHIWQFVTYMFMHGGFGHLLGNIIGLFFFGPIIEARMGGRRFLGMVLLAGILGGIGHTILCFAYGQMEYGLVGFSGAVFAILTAAVIWYPNLRVLLMFLVPVPLRVLAFVYGLLMFLAIIDGGIFPASGVSHIAHLAGIASGILLVKFPSILDWWEDFRVPFLSRRRPTKVRRMNMGHPGRHTDPDDRYNDPHWWLDQ